MNPEIRHALKQDLPELNETTHAYGYTGSPCGL